MTRKPGRKAFSWLWLLLLPLPAMVGYAESRDPRGVTTEISNRAAKGDRLSLRHPSEPEWRSCPPTRRRGDDGLCPHFVPAD